MTVIHQMRTAQTVKDLTAVAAKPDLSEMVQAVTVMRFNAQFVAKTHSVPKI